MTTDVEVDGRNCRIFHTSGHRRVRSVAHIALAGSTAGQKDSPLHSFKAPGVQRLQRAARHIKGEEKVFHGTSWPEQVHY
jgi:hypothetical protein